jgi:gliding motility-associated-like protein
MKRILLFFGVCFLVFKVSFGQTILWTENFNVAPNWTLTGNGSTIISGSAPSPGGSPNSWIINNVGQTIDGSANLHITCTGFICNLLGAPGPIYNASSAANNTNTAAFSNADIPAVTFSGSGPFTLSFQWSCSGASNPNNGSARLIYSTNSGVSWLEWPTNYNGNAGVNNESINVSLLTGFVAGTTPLRLGFRWFSQGTSGHFDPPMIVDNLQITTPAVSANTITTGTITGSPFCAGDNILIPFTSTGTFSAGNIYTAQLSDASGSFAAPVVLGTLNSTANAGNIAGVIPAGTTSGAGYQIRVISSNPAVTGSSFGPITINAQLNATVTISTNPTGAICSGDNVVFSSAITNGGSTPTYQWQLNGANIPGATLASFSTSTLANGDLVSLVLTSSAACVVNSPVNSANYTAQVNQVLPASVSISSLPNAAICPGDNVVFTATPSNGGANPSYQWLLNGSNVSGATSSTFSVSTLVNGDEVSVIMTSNANCVSGNPATSNIITQTVNPAAPVSVALSVLPGGPVCAGTSLTFTASPVNGGSNPTFVWFVNGAVQSGNNTNTFVSNTLNDGDQVTVELTSNVLCSTGNPALSSGIQVQIQTNISASVNISANVNPICAGDTINFSSSLIGAGSSPVFQWLVNGVAISGANDSTFSSHTLNDGDLVVLNMISSSGCVINPNVSSSSFLVNVNPSVSASIVITVNQDTLCSGVSPQFSAVLQNEGTSPVVDWFIDGILDAANQGVNFNPGSISNGQIITAQLTSSLACATPVPAISNPISITVLPDVQPVVSLTVDFDTLCTGTPFNFTANPAVAGGSNPTYTWFLNGVAVPGNISANYSSVLNNGDQVQVELFSNDPCANPTNAISNIITVTVTTQGLLPTLSISAGSLIICSGTPVNFSSLVSNAGTAPGFQWQINGVDVVGETNAQFTSNSLNNGDVVTLVMTPNSICASPLPVVSNSLTMTVNPSVNPTATINATGNIICAGQSVTMTAVVNGTGSSPAFQWFLNGSAIAGATGLSFTTTPTNSDNYTFQLISSDVCDTAGVPVLSAPLIIVVQPNIAPTVSISANDTSVCVNQSPGFSAQISGGGLTPGYSWRLNGVEVSSGSAGYVFNDLQNGDVITFVLTSSAQCASPAVVTSNSISVDVYPLPQVTLGVDQIIQEGDSVQLIASENLSYQYLWTPANGLDCNTCAKVWASPETTTSYAVIVTDISSGCSSSDSILVSVETKEIIFLPTGFTPNADGFNDVLYLRGTGIELFQLDIYDRFGNLVFSTKDQKYGWDGFIEGKSANAGSYTYLLTGSFLSGTAINQKGTLTLVR